MDLYCHRCEEPWDVSYVNHDMAHDEPDYPWDGTDRQRLDFAKATAARFRNGEGCPACSWGRTAPATPSTLSQAAAVLGELLGDDDDGTAAMLEDFQYMGMI